VVGEIGFGAAEFPDGVAWIGCRRGGGGAHVRKVHRGSAGDKARRFTPEGTEDAETKPEGKRHRPLRGRAQAGLWFGVPL
jgi:hypothetical protein